MLLRSHRNQGTQEHKQHEEDEEDEEEVQMGEDGLLMVKRSYKAPILYTPGMGTHVFWWNGRPLLFNRYVKMDSRGAQSLGEAEEISIDSFGRNTTSLRQFFEECNAWASKLNLGRTAIFNGRMSRMGTVDWNKILNRKPRQMSSVVIDKHTDRKSVV